MSNQPNEAAHGALCDVIGDILVSDISVDECARRLLAAIRDGKVPGVYAESPGIDYLKIRHALSGLSGKPAMAAVTMDHIGTIGEQISSLRSALANAEKDQAASARDWEAALSAHDRRVEELNQALAKLAAAERDCAGYKERIHELSDELGACEKERDEARAKLAEAEKELDEALAALGGKGGGG